VQFGRSPGGCSPAWKVIDEEAIDIAGARFYRFVKNADTRLYRLRRD
jgi:hypothetical protein